MSVYEDDLIEAPGADEPAGYEDFTAHGDPTEIGEEGEEVVDVEDAGDVVEVDELVGENAGREHGQRGVLVAHGPEGAVQGVATFDDESAHGARKREGREGRKGQAGGRSLQKRPETRALPALQGPPPGELFASVHNG